jgi:hypothetical protein
MLTSLPHLPSPDTPHRPQLFDEVVLLREGRLVYHGGREGLPAYLRALGFRPPVPLARAGSFGSPGGTFASPTSGHTGLVSGFGAAGPAGGGAGSGGDGAAGPFSLGAPAMPDGKDGAAPASGGDAAAGSAAGGGGGRATVVDMAE